ncbi:MAG: helix-turn-helix transcriptional regulator [Actinomycetes bacterium]
MTATTLSLIPTWRLGALLRNARDRDGRTLADMALSSDRFDLAELTDIEAGNHELTETDIAAVVELYRVDPEELVPGRTDLKVDLDRLELVTAGHTQPLAGTTPTADEVLASYLALVYTMRSTTPGTRVPLRDRDLDVLAQALALAVPEVTERLEEMMVNPSADLQHRSKLLRGRVLLPAAGVLVALTVAGALIFSPAGNVKPSDPANGAVIVTDTVEIGQPLTVTRAPDGSAGPVVIAGEGLNGAQIAPNVAAVGDAQVATRDASGNVNQVNRPDVAAPVTATP